MITIEVAGAPVDAVLAKPPSGSGPGVLMFMDAFGLRPRIDQIAREVASWGYVVLAPNVFHRDGTADELAPTGDITTPEGMYAFFQQAGPRIGHLTTELALADITAYLDTLQALPGVQPGPVGVVGFCMGGRLALRAAGLAPQRVAACAGFHVSGLVTDQPDSPHLVIAGSTAEYLFAHADNDRGLTPADSAALGDTIARAGLRGTSEIYAGSMHGYTMADTAAWNEAAYHRAMDELRALFARTLGESEAA
ncbi:dienelactone hydrolase family protein [Micropruina glycogenica]|nr:dienelactone hydrolase family protein [Micropruina glycogenica]